MSADAGPEDGLLDAVDAIEQTTEDVRAEAARVCELAFALREALDRSQQDLVKAQQELDAGRAAIAEELGRARAEADEALAVIRASIEQEQARLAELHREHAETTAGIRELAQAKELVLSELGRAQDVVLPAVAELVRAQVALQAAVASFEQPPEPEVQEVESGRPIGRIMDLGNDDA